MQEQLLLSVISSGFGDLQNGLSSIGSSLTTLGLVSGNAALALGGLAATLIGSVFNALTSIVGLLRDAGEAAFHFAVDATKEAIAFEDAFAGIAKTVSGVADATGELTEQGAQIREDLEDLAETIPVPFEKLTEIGSVAGQMGIAHDELVPFVETMAQISAAVESLEPEQATQEFARFGNVMGSTVPEIHQTASALVDLGNHTATTEAEILNFAQRIAGIGHIAGLTEADVLGIGAAFTATGTRVEAGGTAVQKVLIEMNTAANTLTSGFIDNTGSITTYQAELRELEAKLLQAQERQENFSDSVGQGTRQLQQIKIEDLTAQVAAHKAAIEGLTESNGKFFEGGSEKLQIFAELSGQTVAEFVEMWESDPGSAFASFVEGLATAGDDATNILEDLELGDQRLLRGFLAVAEGGDLLRDSIERANVAFEEDIALQVEADKRFSTTASKIEIAKNRFTDFRVDVGDKFLPIVNTLLDRFFETGSILEGPVLHAFQVVADFIIEHLPAALEFVDKIMAALIENAPAAQSALEEVADVAGVLFEKALVLGEKALPVISSALGALISGFRTVVSFISDKVVPIFQGAGGDLAFLGAPDGPFGTLASEWETTLKPALIALAGFIGERMPRILKAFGDTWRVVIVPAIQLVSGMLTNLIKVISFLVAISIPGVAAGFELALQSWENFLIVVEAVEDFLRGPFIDAIVKIGDYLKTSWQETVQNATILWETTLKPALLTFSEWVLSDLLPALERFATTLSEGVSNAVQTVSEWFTNLIAQGKELWELISTTLVEAWESLSTTVSDTVTPALETLQTAWETLNEAMTLIVVFIREHLIPLFQDLWDLWVAISVYISEVAAAAIQKARDEFIEFGRAVAEVVIPVVAWFQEKIGLARDKLTELWQEIVDFVQPKLEELSEWISTTFTEVVTAITAKFEEYRLKAREVADAIQSRVQKTIEDLTNYYNEHVVPALEKVHEKFEQFRAKIVEVRDYLVNFFKPILESIRDRIVDIFTEAEKTGDKIKGPFQEAFEAAKGPVDKLRDALSSVGDWIDRVRSRIQALTDAISGFQVPAALEQHSPPPLAQSFAAINSEVERLASASLPKLTEALLYSGRAGVGLTQLVTNSEYTDSRQFILETNTTLDRGDLALEFRTMELATR